MKWIKERDELIAQTMAFVQSVTGKRPAIEVRNELSPRELSTPELSKPELTMSDLATLKKVDSPVRVEAANPPVERPFQMPRMTPLVQSDLREEIQRRVASFRAHQQRFHAEREEYFKSVLAKARGSNGNH